MKRLLFILLFVPLFCNAQLHASGYIICDSISPHIRPAKVGAYIVTPATTTTTNPNEYYFLKSTFANTETYNFGFTGDTLQYQNGSGYVLMGSYSLTFSTNKTNVTVTVAVSINDVVNTLSITSSYMKTSGDAYDLHGLIFAKANHDDKIKILIKSDQSGTVITPIQGSTYLTQIQ